MSCIRIGVLALQGAFHLHKNHIEALGAQYTEVTSKKDFEFIDALILPGGESSVLLKLLKIKNIEQDLCHFISKKPVWGICAGAILCAKNVLNPNQYSFGALDMTIERNAFGSQIASHEEHINNYLVSYIRAPKILSVGAGVRVLGTHKGFPSWVEHEKIIITTFHPETNLNFPSPWHQRLIELQSKS